MKVNIDFCLKGIVKIMEMALDHVNPKRDKPIHLSFDVDGIDPTYCPSTGTTVKGGLTYREAIYICETVAGLYLSFVIPNHTFVYSLIKY